MHTLIHETQIDGQYPVKIYQYARGSFRVTYGLQARGGLTYAQACQEFGQCVFHALACAGSIQTNEVKQ